MNVSILDVIQSYHSTSAEGVGFFFAIWLVWVAYFWRHWYGRGQTNIKPMNNDMSEISVFVFSQANHLLPPVSNMNIIGPLMVRQVYQQIRDALQRGYRGSASSVAFDK